MIQDRNRTTFVCSNSLRRTPRHRNGVTSSKIVEPPAYPPHQHHTPTMRPRFLSLLLRLESSLVGAGRVVDFSSAAKTRYQPGITTMGCATSKVRISGSAGNQHEGMITTNGTTKQEDDEFVEGVVCKDSEIGENEMKTFELGEGKVLLVKQKGTISAIGTKCTHYGAPLVNGALGNGRIRCQWHGACFNILNGDIEDFPGLDSLPCYQVTVENSEVKVRAKKTDLENNKRIKTMCKRDEREAQNIVVIGGGPAGATCVEALRQECFKGTITMVCKENCLPYDRVKVSKAMDFEIEKAQFRTDDFYKEHDISVIKGNAATAVDTTNHKVTLSDGTTLNYDRLFLATGLKANKANIDGAELQNVVVLRDYEHSKYTNAQLNENIEVVVLGSSFVAMEAANYCLNKVKKVTLIARSNVPFKALLGERIGAAFKKLFEDKGVNFVVNSGIKRCIGMGGKVSEVELNDGTMLKADLVVMGVGSSCNTEFLQNSGIEMRKDGSIEVDDYMESNVKNVYVGGDTAHAPVWSYHSQKSTIGHYPLAHYHGKIAALNMLGKAKKAEAVPYFWTMVFGKGLRYAGHGSYDDIIYTGDVEGLKFVAFYLDKDEVVAASSCGMDPIVSQFAEVLSQGRKLYRKDLTGDPLAWTKTLHKST